MNEPDKHAFLIDRLVNLEEEIVLEAVKERLYAGDDPFSIIEDAQEAMHLVGVRYEQRQYYISGMMMAGEIFREVMELVQPVLLQHLSASESGHILLATIQGDIHDIGKNIFGTLLRCHGFTVTDLGVDVPPALLLEEAIRAKPDLIALSGLLTVSYDSMRTAVQQIRRVDDLHTRNSPVIIGGGMVNAMVCAFIGAEYWASDAMFGVQLCKQIISESRGGVDN